MWQQGKTTVGAAFCPGPDWKAGQGTCGGCGKTLIGRSIWFCKGEGPCSRTYFRNHHWGYARSAAIQRDKGCVRCRSTERLEVNHIEPRVGRGYGNGCHNHQDNLETLCHPHHVEVTTQQRRARAAESRRREGEDQLALPIT